MSRFGGQRLSRREQLVFYVQELERAQQIKDDATECLRESFDAAKRAGYDPATLRVVLKLRKMTPDQRRERRALETIYLAALGMLEGDPLTDEARRRLDPDPEPPRLDEAPDPDGQAAPPADLAAAPPTNQPETPAPANQPEAPPQPALPLKAPDEARQEGIEAAAAGKRVYDNPYRAGDPCRAAWDEGWCAQRQSHGMDIPAAYQRRSAKPPAPNPGEKRDGPSDGPDDADRGDA